MGFFEFCVLFGILACWALCAMAKTAAGKAAGQTLATGLLHKLL